MKPTFEPAFFSSITIYLAAASFGFAGTVDPEAATAVKAMSEKLAASKSLTVSGKRTDSADLAKMRLAPQDSTLSVSLQRPNKVTGKTVQGDAERQFYFDGKSATLVEVADKVYASAPVSGSIDDMVEQLQERFGFMPPLGDLLGADPGKNLLTNESSGKVVGTEKVGGVDCKHLSFSREDLEWEMWIGEDNLPRRFIIRYKEEPGKDLSVTIDGMKWDLDAKIADEAFAFTAPEGMKKINLLSADEFSKK